MAFSSAFILAVLGLCVVASEWMVRRTFLRHFGTALLVIVLTAVVANLGIIPAGSSAEAPVPVYEAIFSHLAPLSIFWLLLRVNLRQVLRAGLPILFIFGLGSIGTAVGVMAGFAITGPDALGPLSPALAGMFTATYTGGSVNFNALALEYDVVREGTLYAGTVVVDNILTAVWMVATIAIPRLLKPRATAGQADVSTGDPDEETVRPFQLATLVALGFFALHLARWISAWSSEALFPIPTIITVTIIALALAQVPAVSLIPGSQLLGMTAVYVFLAVIGAFCDVRALADIGEVGLSLSIVATTCVVVHGSITFGAAKLFRVDPDVAAVASQANIGGGTSALALARGLGRPDLVLPAVLVGSLGNAVGTFLGFAVARFMGA